MQRFSGITSDSRRVKKGFVFVAVRGLNVDGHDFIPDAIKNGAKIIVGEKDIRVPSGVTYIKVKDSREVLGKYASEFYGNPSEKLRVIGVTGTKGKTTTVHLIYHILSRLGKKVGMISSISASIAGREIDTGFHVTSPDVVTLEKLLAEMVDAGCEYAVIEVSSHGIGQKRIAGIKFNVGVLTNIAPEHLDYHKTLAEYRRVKFSFINSAKTKVFGKENTEIDVLPGKFNNLDAQAAIDAVSSLGIDKRLALKTLSTFKLPEGRLDEVGNNKGIKIYIDFAHTPNSLTAVLTHLKTEANGRLIAVFGCAGERDKRKRFQMGKISVKLADFSVFTAEDPRSENIFAILSKMSEGARNAGGVEGKTFVRIPERNEAIAYALSIAKKGDTVAFLGKGHEKSLAYKGFEHPWNDREAIENFLSKNEKVSAIILAAGKGSRMHSTLPKILHEICGRPLIAYTLQNLRRAKVGEIIAVLSFKRNLVRRFFGGAVKVAIQKSPKGGTADATAAGLPFVSKEADYVLVMYGDDSAFYSPETINKMIDCHIRNKAKLSFVTLIRDDPHGLGRIVRDKNRDLIGIVEEKDATDSQRKIKEVNDGLYVFDKKWLTQNLPKVQKSPASGEYYIVELIKIGIDRGDKVIAYTLPNDYEWQGINTPEEFEKAKKKMEKRLEPYNEQKS